MQYCCKIHITNQQQHFFALRAWYNLLNIWKIRWITTFPFRDELGVNYMRIIGFGENFLFCLCISSWYTTGNDLWFLKKIVKLRQWGWDRVQVRTCNNFCLLSFTSSLLLSKKATEFEKIMCFLGEFNSSQTSKILWVIFFKTRKSLNLKIVFHCKTNNNNKKLA